MELVTSVRVVCDSRPRVVAILHVCELVAAFLAPPDSWTVERAIRRGCTHLVWHLLDEFAEDLGLHNAIKLSRARWFMSDAASMGNVALLEHLVSRFRCFVDDWAVTQAVGGGHLDALQWLYDQALARLPPGEDVQAFTKKLFPNHFMLTAATVGHLEMLQWIHERVGSVSADVVLQGAVKNGHLNVLEWVPPMVTTPLSDYCFIQTIALGGHIGVAKILHAKAIL